MNIPDNHEEEEYLKITGNTGGFTVPENFFADSRQRITGATSEKGFVVPDGYFEKLQDNITSATLNKPVRLAISYRNPWTVAAGIAASLLIGFALYLFVPRAIQVETLSFDPAQINQLSDDEIISYFNVTDLGNTDMEVIAVNLEDHNITQEEEYLLEHPEDLILNEL